MRAWLVLVISLVAADVRADDKAAAEQLFEDGKALVARGDYAAACGKFDKSYELDPVLGTRLNLADCHEHVGKLATAWAEYHEIEEAAGRVADDKSQERAKYAREHAVALGPRLAKVELHAPAVAGLVVKRDGRDVTATLGVAVPVDPGRHELVASAPGYTTWTGSVTIAGEGTTTPLDIPVLVAVPQVAPPPPPPTPTPATTLSLEEQQRQFQDQIRRKHGTAPAAPPPVVHDPTYDDRERERTSARHKRLAGYVVGGVGAGFAVTCVIFTALSAHENTLIQHGGLATGDDIQHAFADGHRYNTDAYLFGVLGALGLGIGGGLILLNRDPGELAVTAAVRPGFTGLAIGGSL